MTDTSWFKSSYSDGGNDTCVEVRLVAGQRVGVRDSKNPDGGAFWVTPGAWAGFVAAIRDDSIR